MLAALGQRGREVHSGAWQRKEGEQPRALAAPPRQPEACRGRAHRAVWLAWALGVRMVGHGMQAGASREHPHIRGFLRGGEHARKRGREGEGVAGRGGEMRWEQGEEGVGRLEAGRECLTAGTVKMRDTTATLAVTRSALHCSDQGTQR